MKESLSIYFAALEAPRSTRNLRHPFMTLIGTTLLAMLCGIDSFSGIQDFTDLNLEELEQYFDFPHGFPSHDTYRRFWDALSPTQFMACFSDFVGSLKKIDSNIINIDGKTIRNSGKGKPLHIVSAWCSANHMIFGQQKIDSKSNEITAIPKLLDLLDIENKIITIDAMGAQRAICQQIIDGQG